MFIELIDALRCPNTHEESWLVAASNRMEARHIVEGMLGCPVCAAEYPISSGVVDFRGGVESARAVLDALREPPDDLPLRIAACLDLSDATGFAVLMGSWGACAETLASLVELPLVLVDPPAHIAGSPGISVLRTAGQSLPLATTSARAVAIDGDAESRVASAVRVAKPKARVIGPAELHVASGIKEIARDDFMWVGERDAAVSPLVTLHVRRAE